jgi:Zn finger protein HypA/HybF involved in hydrogenase expression
VVLMDNRDLYSIVEKVVLKFDFNKRGNNLKQHLKPYIDDVIKRTSYLDENSRFVERIYHIYNNLYEKVKCKTCNKDLTFFIFNKPYSEYCKVCGTKTKKRNLNLSTNLSLKLRNKYYDFYKIKLGKYLLTSKKEFLNITELKIKCEECGRPYIRKKAYLNGCPKCSKKGTSKMEKEIFSFLKENGVDNLKENTKKIIPPLELDAFLIDYNLAIELDGLY